MSVKVVPYDTHWPILFEQASRVLTQVFAGRLIKIEHFGSTSVPGLAAKPVIDIFVFVHDTSNIEQYHDAMKRCGYQPKGKQERTNCYVFEKLSGPSRTHKVNVCTEDNKFSLGALLFRDYLRVDKRTCEEYQKLKKELAQKYYDDPPAYANGKLQFITKTIEQAKRYFESYVSASKNLPA